MPEDLEKSLPTPESSEIPPEIKPEPEPTIELESQMPPAQPETETEIEDSTESSETLPEAKPEPEAQMPPAQPEAETEIEGAIESVAPSEIEPEAVPQSAILQDKISRFRLQERVEHWAFMISFTTLAITGLIQKFSQLQISKSIIIALGGIEYTRIIHHTAATIMMVVVIYHIGEIFYKLYVNRLRPELLPNLLDVRNVWQTIRYNLFLSNRPPQQGRYSFEEKMEYWAVVWGTVVMVFTGFMMWNPLATTSFLPGEVIPSAKLAHGMEAILAVAAIILWHFYHVLIKTLNRSMFNGKLSMHQMEEEHPIELADIRAGLDKPEIKAEERKKRLRVFIPVYSIVAALGVAGIFWFVTFEKTAITTIPPREIATIYAPQTPTPFPTPLPTATPAPLPEGGANTWDAGIGNILNTKCGGCHNSATKLGGLDLTSFAGAISGGKDGPIIVEGDPTNSKLVQVQQAGGHPGQLTTEEIALIIKWIEAGALEK